MHPKVPNNRMGGIDKNLKNLYSGQKDQRDLKQNFGEFIQSKIKLVNENQYKTRNLH